MSETSAREPLVSVVMPVHNAAVYLRQAIESILAQGYPHIELLLCDDGSTDASWEIARSFSDPRIRWFRNTDNLGYLLTCNRLFAEACGQIITFQDADDWSEPDRLEHVVSAFQQNADADVSISYYNFVNSSGRLIQERAVPFDFHAFGSDVDYWEYFCGATIAVRREVYETIGGYRPELKGLGGEDYDWLFRICQRHRGVQIPRVLYNYRLHESAWKRTGTLAYYYDLDLVSAGRRLLLEEGRDYVSQEESAWRSAKIQELERPFHTDPTRVFREEARYGIRARQWGRSAVWVARAVTRAPHRRANWSLLASFAWLLVRVTLGPVRRHVRKHLPWRP